MDTSTPNTLSIRFGGNTIRITSEHPVLDRRLNIHFKHCLGEAGTLIAEYTTITLDNDLFAISRDGNEWLTDLNLEQVLFQLMQDGLTQLNGASTTELIFHAAGLSFENYGVALCGKSGSGKSTLAAGLLKDGFHYLTDEVIAYPLNGGLIRGFARSLVLKKNSAFIWQDLDAQDSEKLLHFDNGSVWVEPTLLSTSPICGEVLPRLLLFPSYQEDAPLHFEKLSAAQTLFHLLQTLVNARNLPNHGMEAAAQLARQVPAYRLHYSDIEQAAAWIQITLTAI